MHKIILDARMLYDSGIGVYLRELIHLLEDNSEYHINYIIQENKAVPDYIKSEDLIFFESLIYSISEQSEFFKKSLQADLFWSPHFNIPLFYFKAKKRLVTIHDVYHLAYFDTLSFKQKIYAKVMIHAAVRMSDRIITVSEFSKNEIIKHTGCNEKKIAVIHNGTKQKCYLKEKAAIQEKYGLPQQYILFVGNVKPHKNLKTLVKAFKLLLDKKITESYSLVIVGKKEGFLTGDNAVVSLVQNDPTLSSKVHFTGFVEDDDLDSIYKNASLFVFPSLYEGFGLPPLEAMVCGCPVISSHNASMPEICGDAVEYFDPENEHEIMEKMEFILTDDIRRNELIAKGYERVKVFTWKKSFQKHMDVFTSLTQS